MHATSHDGLRAVAAFRGATRRGWPVALLAIAAACIALVAPPADAATKSRSKVATPAPAPLPTGDQLIVAARDAYGRKDADRLRQLRDIAVATHHPLAQWADYWNLTSRIGEVQWDEADAFFARWPGTYVEDRFRNDWLLELGKRRDWVRFKRDVGAFKMDDDRQVSCYKLLLAHWDGQPVKDEALSLWLQQRQRDEGCQLLATTLYTDGVFKDADVFEKLRVSIENGRTAAARAGAEVLGDDASRAVDSLVDNPVRYLARDGSTADERRNQFAALAVARAADASADAAARLLNERWANDLKGDAPSWAWAITARHGALELNPDTVRWVRAAWETVPDAHRGHPAWSDETLGWMARASLRLGQGKERWRLARRAIAAMSPDARSDATWVYWDARSQIEAARDDERGEPERIEARKRLAALSTRLEFYGQLAAEDLGTTQTLPDAPPALTSTERREVRRLPGLQRALQNFSLGLRSEAVREWNFTLIGMDERQLLAAADLACDSEIWDRCINTSEKTRSQVDMAQRFPMPLASSVVPKANAIGLDPAYVYGLIRQESRFIMDARSHVGASGLMQLMPATAKWTARKIGLDYHHGLITDRDTNLTLGTSYLKLVLDDLDGSQAMGAAAYNAGPGRPRRWREGPTLDAAIWVENVPLSETRDYVKKVLSNATYYRSVLDGKPASLKARLGQVIGPRPRDEAPADESLP